MKIIPGQYSEIIDQLKAAIAAAEITTTQYFQGQGDLNTAASMFEMTTRTNTGSVLTAAEIRACRDTGAHIRHQQAVIATQLCNSGITFRN